MSDIDKLFTFNVLKIQAAGTPPPGPFPSHMLPLSRRGTCVYLAGGAGGFDLRDCPHPEALAALIVNAVNNRR